MAAGSLNQRRGGEGDSGHSGRREISVCWVTAVERGEENFQRLAAITV